jgi:hypothetical protein
VRRLAGDHVVEGHGDVGAEGPLNLHGSLGGELTVGPVDVTLELDAVLVDPAQALEGEHLEPARVGEHRPGPGGEAVEAAHVLHHGFAGPQVEVVGVAQDDLRAGACDLAGAEPADHAVGADRHERGRRDGAVRQGEGARASEALGGLETELEHQG